MQRFIVLWSRPGFGLAFQADHYAESPRAAREAHKAMFPADRVCGVKLPRGNGRWIA